MKQLVFLCLMMLNFILIPCYSFCQINKDEVDLLVKLVIFQESTRMNGYVVDQKYLTNFIRLNFKMDTLRMRGFEHFIFLAVDPVPTNFNEVPNDNLQLIPADCQEYIVAVDIRLKRIFKLKGFIYNDFHSFMFLLQDWNYPSIHSRKKFSKNYSVDKLDLACLYKAYRPKRINRVKNKCLEHCSGLKTTH